MADPKKSAKTAPKKGVKVMSEKDCKTTKGGLKVGGGLAGPEDFGILRP